MTNTGVSAGHPIKKRLRGGSDDTGKPTYFWTYTGCKRSPWISDDRFYRNTNLPYTLESGTPQQSIGGSAPPVRSANGDRGRREKDGHIVQLPAVGSEDLENIGTEFMHANSLAGILGARPSLFSNLGSICGV